MCSGVLQRVAVCCSVLQRVDLRSNNDSMSRVLQRVAACCSVLQCVGFKSNNDSLPHFADREMRGFSCFSLRFLGTKKCLFKTNNHGVWQ